VASSKSQTKLLVIVGPTASGKSDLAMKIAKKFNGEIICADSRTIYKGMDIGTAKPSKADQKAVRHWGLDLIKPGQTYSAAMFKDYANAAISNIQKRGRLPILVGGTGLYVDGVVFDYSFVGQRLNPIYLILPSSILRKVIARKGWLMPENIQNRRHLLGTIRRRGMVGSRQKNPREGTLIVGLLPSDDQLKKRISLRAEQMFKKGIAEEAGELFATYGLRTFAGADAIVYGIIARLFKDQISEAEAIELFKKADWQYARRQRTWFKRNTHINWFNNVSAAETWSSKQLTNA
jgi:tRNA dimethylallyltransferase